MEPNGSSSTSSTQRPHRNARENQASGFVNRPWVSPWMCLPSCIKSSLAAILSLFLPCSYIIFTAVAHRRREPIHPRPVPTSSQAKFRELFVFLGSGGESLLVSIAWYRVSCASIPSIGGDCMNSCSLSSWDYALVWYRAPLLACSSPQRRRRPVRFIGGELSPLYLDVSSVARRSGTPWTPPPGGTCMPIP